MVTHSISGTNGIFGSADTAMVKERVRTFYTDGKNTEFHVLEDDFIGVVYAAYSPDWKVRWMRDITDYPGI